MLLRISHNFNYKSTEAKMNKKAKMKTKKFHLPNANDASDSTNDGEEENENSQAPQKDEQCR